MNWKKDFPIFDHHPSWLYLDSAATTQKPRVILDAERVFLETSYSNIHRGLDTIAQKATEQFEQVREQVAAFIHAPSSSEIIFTRNATESLNLVAWLERERIKPGDEIVITLAEHHSNILPWRRLAEEKGAQLIMIEPRHDGYFNIEELDKKLSPRTRLIATAHVSNVLGYVTPVLDIVAKAKQVGARVVLDTAQSAGRIPIDVQALGVDYAAFSGHKMYGPTGTGFLYARSEFLKDVEPMIVGGGTVVSVTKEHTQWQKAPWKFEAGTPHISGVIGLGATLTYLQKLTWPEIIRHEEEITSYTLEKLLALSGLRLYGPTHSQNKKAIFSFILESDGQMIHPHDVATCADEHRVAIRGGHHCAGPLMKFFQVPALNRMSFGLYNSRDDVDRVIDVLQAIQEKFKQ